MSEGATRRRGEFQLLTSSGPAAIAVVRLCGPLVESFLQGHVRKRTKVEPRVWPVGCVVRAELVDEAGEAIDDMLVSVHALVPTWDVRLHLHGSPGVARCCRRMLGESGFAERSEAVSTLWRSESTIEAEMYAMLPSMLTLRGVQWLTRQSRLLSDTLRLLAKAADLDDARRQCRQIVDRRRIRDWFARPLSIALVGPPNAGKSTLANALADQHVSLVSPEPGTTRDWLEIPGEIDGFPVLWLDTAGLREGVEAFEAEGIRRTKKLMESADAVLLVLDATAPGALTRAGFPARDVSRRPGCVALNKSDLIGSGAKIAVELPVDWQDLAVSISATQRSGLDALTGRLLESAGYETAVLEAPAAFTDRQVEALEGACQGDASCFLSEVQRCLAERIPS